MKYTVKGINEYKQYALEVASKMMQYDLVFVRADDVDFKYLFDLHYNRK